MSSKLVGDTGNTKQAVKTPEEIGSEEEYFWRLASILYPEKIRCFEACMEMDNRAKVNHPEKSRQNRDTEIIDDEADEKVTSVAENKFPKENERTIEEKNVDEMKPPDQESECREKEDSNEEEEERETEEEKDCICWEGYEDLEDEESAPDKEKDVDEIELPSQVPENKVRDNVEENDEEGEEEGEEMKEEEEGEEMGITIYVSDKEEKLAKQGSEIGKECREEDEEREDERMKDYGDEEDKNDAESLSNQEKDVSKFGPIGQVPGKGMKDDGEEDEEGGDEEVDGVVKVYDPGESKEYGEVDEEVSNDCDCDEDLIDGEYSSNKKKDVVEFESICEEPENQLKERREEVEEGEDDVEDGVVKDDDSEEEEKLINQKSDNELKEEGGDEAVVNDYEIEDLKGERGVSVNGKYEDEIEPTSQVSSNEMKEDGEEDEEEEDEGGEEATASDYSEEMKTEEELLGEPKDFDELKSTDQEPEDEANENKKDEEIKAIIASLFNIIIKYFPKHFEFIVKLVNGHLDK
ncbi:hypothetical protein Aperf_G00000002493 [Anoplocephala perfoliata]